VRDGRGGWAVEGGGEFVLARRGRIGRTEHPVEVRHGDFRYRGRDSGEAESRWETCTVVVAGAAVLG